MSTTTSPTLEAALTYLSLGWSPIPACPPDHANTPHTHKCSSPGKAPLFSWKHHQTKPPTVQEVQSYWAAAPTANVAICLGQASGIVGLDIDGPKGMELLHKISEGELPDTCEFSTPGGGHRLLYAILPNETIPNLQWAADEPHEEFRLLSDGRITIMPPSVHASGGTYAWVTGKDPHSKQIAIRPAWLANAKALVQTTNGQKIPLPAGPISTQASRLQRAQSYLKSCEPAVAGMGTASNHTFKLACKLIHGFALSDDEALAAFKNSGWNARCTDHTGKYYPWTDSELLHKIQDARQKGTSASLLNGAPTQPSITSVNLANAKKATITWLWPHWIPAGKLVVLDGDPGLGKSTVLLDIAARISTTAHMPNGTQGIPGTIIIMSAEDGVEDTILPRLTAAGAALHKIECLTEINGQPPVIPHHVADIHQRIKTTNAKLLIIDPLTAYLDADARSDQEIRRALHPLARMADTTGCAVVYLRHLNKSSGTRAIYRGGGSIAIIGAARSGILIAPHPEDDSHKILAQTKHNLSDLQQSLRYSLEYNQEHGACKVIWHGHSHLKADDLLEHEGTAEKDAKLDAIQFLETVLADGPKAANEIFAQAAAQKVASPDALKRAKSKMGITSTPIKDGHGKLVSWLWSLNHQGGTLWTTPPSESSTDEPPTSTTITNGEQSNTTPE